MTGLAAQLLESPRRGFIKAPQLTQPVQANLNDEINRRQAFYEWMNDDRKAEFINGEIIVHSPALEKHNAAVLCLGMLPSVFVVTREIGIGRKALVELTRDSYDRTADAAGHLLFRTGQSGYYPAPDLVVKVLSKCTQKADRKINFENYVAHGVAEYWLVDPTCQTIELFTLDVDTEAYVDYFGSAKTLVASNRPVLRFP